MQLIAPLAAGIRGAENGFAEIYRRGTSTRATIYSDFEATTTLPSSDVALDANGGASVYAGEFVRVVVRDSEGTIVRDFTNGESAEATDYIGPSFTGVNYSTGEAGVNQPVSLADALDRWATSSGSSNFNVLYGGSAATLATIAADVFNTKTAFVNVKDFGAIGDGATDDRTAIVAAIAASSGNVYFPAGNYRITTSSLSISESINFLGTGPGSCSIIQATAGVAVLTSAGVSTQSLIQGIKLVHSGAASAGIPEVTIADGTRIRFDNCVFGSSSRFTQYGINIVTTGANSECVVDNCEFTNSIAGIRDQRTAAPVSPIFVSNSKFIANTTGAWAGVSGAYFVISTCVFSNGAQSSGASSGVDFTADSLPATSAFGVVSGCVFTNPGGGTASGVDLPAVIPATAVFFEDQNTFGGSVTAIYGGLDVTFASKGAWVKLGSRESRVQNVTNNGNFTISSDLYGTVIVTRTTSANSTITVKMVPEGTRGRLLVLNSSGGTITLQAVSGPDTVNDFPAGGAGVAITNGQMKLWEYVGIHGAAARHTLPIADGVSCGTPV